MSWPISCAWWSGRQLDLSSRGWLLQPPLMLCFYSFCHWIVHIFTGIMPISPILPPAGVTQNFVNRPKRGRDLLSRHRWNDFVDTILDLANIHEVTNKSAVWRRRWYVWKLKPSWNSTLDGKNCWRLEIVCHWGLGELIPSWSFTLRNHELIHHTSRCIDMFTHHCHSDIRCVFSNSFQRHC